MINIKPYQDRNSLIDEVRNIVKKEISEAIKKLREGKVSSYSNIMKNSKIDTSDIHSSIPSFTNREVYDNKNSYTKMKNRVNYGISTESKTFVNKASNKTSK